MIQKMMKLFMFQEENGYRRATADSSVTHNSTPMMKGEDEGR